MPVLCRPAVAFPENVLTLDDTLALAERLYRGHPRYDLAVELARNMEVQKRHLVQPLELTLRHPGFEARNLVYAREVKARVPAVTAEALAYADLTADQIDAIIYVSCTGFTMPSPTAWMINNLGFRTDTHQLPIAQMGCAGGGAAINRAHDFCRARPGSHVLIVSCEFCSLCYQPGDRSVAALLSNALFGDAVAAVVVRGDEHLTGIRLERGATRLIPGTEDWIAYDVKETGFHFLLDRRVPDTMEQVAPALVAVAADQGWDGTDLDFYIVHAGGPRLLDTLAKHLGVVPDAFAHSRTTLALHGNIASAVVLDALRRQFDAADLVHGATGLIVGFGPGITAEIALGTWTVRA